ncbi:MAG TPA: PAS domain S-box protein [Candidatus Limnocylindrales bacterium]|nr:PAS domain S-box protein [Candidatus Limnocylindrales bacterium]
MSNRKANPPNKHSIKGAELKVDERILELQRVNERLKAENIELKMVEKRLISSERRYTTIFNNAQDTIFIATDGTFTDCNPKTMEMYGCRREDIIGHKPWEFSPPQQPDGRDSREKAMEKIFSAQAGNPQRFEWKHRKPDGTVFDTEINLNQIEVEGVPGLLAVVRDISESKKAQEELQRAHNELEIRVEQRTTELKRTNELLELEIVQRRQAEEALRQSEVKHRHLVEYANSIILEMNTSGNITFINKFGLEFFGYAEAEILGHNVIGTIVPAKDSAGQDLEAMIRDVVHDPAKYAHNENENMLQNGERVWIVWTNQPLYDEEGLLSKILCIGINRTEQKRTEEILAQQTKEQVAANERNRLARDLHDAVSQTLFSASLIADVLPRIWERNPEEGRKQLKEVRQLTRGALAEMRTLLLELRPSSLIEAELPYLLSQLGESISGRTHLPVIVSVEGQVSCPPEVKVALYRIAQEALNNVAKHAGARQANVKLLCETEKITLKVSDDGRGFDMADVPSESLGLGIMRERARDILASLSVQSKMGQGTEVIAVWQIL